MSAPAVRAPARADLAGVLALIVARDVADLGRPDVDEDDVLADWEEPTLDLARDAWVVEGAGRLAGYAIAGAGGHLQVDVHPQDEGRGLGRRLLDLVEARAITKAAAAPGAELRLTQLLAGSNARGRRLLESAGYRVGQRYWRIQVALAETAAPAWPKGVRVETHRPGETDAEVHALIQEAFAEIPGTIGETLEQWRARRMLVPDYDPTAWLVARDGAGAVAGAALSELWPEEGTGYLAQLATRRDWRGRGLGRALLLGTFADQRRRGLTTGALDVNALNESGLRLYESVCMEVAWRTDRYERTVTVTGWLSPRGRGGRLGQRTRISTPCPLERARRLSRVTRRHSSASASAT